MLPGYRDTRTGGGGGEGGGGGGGGGGRAALPPESFTVPIFFGQQSVQRCFLNLGALILCS